MRTRILVITVLALGLLFLASGAMAQSKITAPTNKQEVSMEGNEVRVTIPHAVQETSKPVLFIRDPMYLWWPWLNSAKVSGDSHNWVFRGVIFGNENDKGGSFKLIVVECTEKELDEGVMLGKKVFSIGAGKMIPNSRMKAFLKYKPKKSQSASVTVIRD